MKNKEKYANEIIEIAITGHSAFAVNKITGEMVRCSLIRCSDCLFNKTGQSCDDLCKGWAEAEYKEPLSAKAVTDELRRFCGSRKCRDCKYSSSANTTECHIRYVFDNYKVTEKVAENE